MAILDSEDGKVGYKEIAAYLIGEIESGRLPCGAPLPPSRELARQYGVSRDTIVNVYRHLLAASYVETAGARGTFVSYQLADKLAESLPPRPTPSLSKLGQSLNKSEKAAPRSNDFAILNFAAVPKESLPVRKWRELMQKRCQVSHFRNLAYDVNALGRIELREALAGHLNRTKGISCEADQIALFNISISGVGIILKLLMEEGDTIALEDPGFGAIKQLAKFHNFKLMPVPVDSQGIDTDYLAERASQGAVPKIVYVTPTHQDPTGRTMSLARRKALLTWAEANDAWIIEDDFDSYFSYSGPSLPSLKALDTTSRVIYVSTFWQILYPLTTASYLIVPPELVSALSRCKALSEGIAEPMVQLAIADMLESGFLVTHLRRWNKIFAARRRTLLYELKNALDKRIEIQKQGGGLYCLVSLPDWPSEAVLNAARQSDFPLVSIAHHFELEPENLYLIYFASIAEEDARAQVKAFVSALSN